MLPGNSRMVCSMTYQMHGALVASLGAVALLLAANQALARSGSAPAAAHAGKFAHRPFAPSLRHHRRHDARAFFPATGSFYEPAIGEPPLDVAQPMSQDMPDNYTYDG